LLRRTDVTDKTLQRVVGQPTFVIFSGQTYVKIKTIICEM